MSRPFIIAEGGKSRCGIAAASDGGPDAQHTTGILAGLIRQIAGVPVCVAESAEQLRGNVILTGEPATNKSVRELLLAGGVKLDRQGRIRSLLHRRNGDQGFVICFARVRGRDCVALAGNSHRGTFYAVQTFADRIYRAGGAFVVDRRNETASPAFEYRSAFTGLGGTEPLVPHALEKDFTRKDGAIDVRGFVNWLARYRVNHLAVFMFHLNWGLAYPSRSYPKAVNKFHPNVKREFFHELVREAKKNFMTVWLVMEFPDKCLGLVRAYPELGLKCSRDAVVHSLSKKWWDRFLKADMAREDFRPLQDSDGGLNVHAPAVMRFWKTFWRELLTTYPEVDGIGVELCEHLTQHPRADDFHDQMWRYYKGMVDTAEKTRPGLAYWMWRAPGGRVVARRRGELPNLTYVYWGDGPVRMPAGQAQGTKTDWYLTHGSAEADYEPWIKRHCIMSARLGLSGMQKRMATFRPLHHVYSAFNEFTWSPETSWSEYAARHVMRTHHVKDAARARAYAEDLQRRSARLPRRERG